MIKQKTDSQTYKEINNIATHLLSGCHSCIDPGLYYGKTGIAIFFFHMYKYTSKNIYKEKGEQLFTEIQSLIDKNYTINYNTGLSGIGAGIEYLCRHKLIEGDSNEILEDFDKKIIQNFKYIPHHKFYISNGLCGIGKYLISRSISQKREHLYPNKDIENAILFILDLINYKINNEFLKYKLDYLNPVWRDILSFLKELSIHNPSNKCTELINILVLHKIKNKKRFIFPPFESEKTDEQLGLFEGYAGRGMYLLQKINKSMKNWSNLL